MSFTVERELALEVKVDRMGGIDSLTYEFTFSTPMKETKRVWTFSYRTVTMKDFANVIDHELRVLAAEERAQAQLEPAR